MLVVNVLILKYCIVLKLLRVFISVRVKFVIIVGWVRGKVIVKKLCYGFVFREWLVFKV